MLRTRVSVWPKAGVQGTKRTTREDHGHVIDRAVDLSLGPAADTSTLVGIMTGVLLNVTCTIVLM